MPSQKFQAERMTAAVPAALPLADLESLDNENRVRDVRPALDVAESGATLPAPSSHPSGTLGTRGGGRECTTTISRADRRLFL